MDYLKIGGHYQEIESTDSPYREYLESVRDKLPPDAYAFAAAPWHYDLADHRSLHCSWVEEVALREEPSATQKDRTQIVIRICLLGPYHDGHTFLLYTGVHRYWLEGITERVSHGERFAGHGNWVLDEVRLAPGGRAMHEIAFSSGAHWLIECDSIGHSTTIPAGTRRLN